MYRTIQNICANLFSKYYTPKIVKKRHSTILSACFDLSLTTHTSTLFTKVYFMCKNIDHFSEKGTVPFQACILAYFYDNKHSKSVKKGTIDSRRMC